MKTKEDDDHLISEFWRGNETVFNTLIKKYESEIHDHVLLIVKEEDEARNITQDVFLKVLIKLRKKEYQPQNEFRAWLYTIARNKSIDCFRKKQKYEMRYFSELMIDKLDTLDRYIEIPEENQEVAMIMKENDEALYTLLTLSGLTESEIEVVKLRYFDNLNFKEISKMIGKKNATSRGLGFKGIRKMRKFISQTGLPYSTFY
jgi:RNA polymerase sigma factor (sigma-70 family)